MYDLNDIVVNGTEWSLNYAWSINDSSQIVGIGERLNPYAHRRGYLLTVVPEPVSSILFLTGAGVLAGARYLKRKQHRKNL